MRAAIPYDVVKAPPTPKPRKRPRAVNPNTGGHLFPSLVFEPLRAFTRGLPCILVRTGVCRGPVEAAHVRSRGAGGPDFDNLVSLCQWHHQEQHRMGVRSFEYRYQVRLRPLARKLTSAWLHGRKST